MGEYAAFLLILAFGFACGYGTARARGGLNRIERLETYTLRPGDTVVVRYRGYMSEDDRVMVANSIRARFAPQAPKVVLMESTVDMTVVAERYDVKQPEPMRRRDDNRAQRAPEEPWS